MVHVTYPLERPVPISLPKLAPRKVNPPLNTFPRHWTHFERPQCYCPRTIASTVSGKQ
ncbi:unnamed protein product [Mycena citricolor]|uniref:Uncharacterized protein n=1 Tax=Mycena citricolor TaxID=2018698 RepID=A0AAD2Q0W5_9AGAR|nr:unnamed protein product [Mycena citricolor]CAK5278938.1 unnamed protein product [Mycena citricolor]